MTNWKSWLVFASALVIAPTARCQCLQPLGGPTATTLTLSAVRDKVKVGTSIPLIVTMTNNSGAVISVWGSHHSFAFDVHDSHGKLAKETRAGYFFNGHHDLSNIGPSLSPEDAGRFLHGNGACGPLGPGESATGTEHLEELYDLSEPGQYTVQAHKPDPISGKDVTSNSIVLTVEPRPQTSEAAESSRPSLALFISPSKETLRVGGSVEGTVYMTNQTGHAISQDCAGFTMLVYDGKETPLQPLPGSLDALAIRDRRAGIVRPCMTIPAWDTVGGVIGALERGYDLSKPGTYTVQASQFDGKTKTWVKSNTLTLTVTP